MPMSLLWFCLRQTFFRLYGSCFYCFPGDLYCLTDGEACLLHFHIPVCAPLPTHYNFF